MRAARCGLDARAPARAALRTGSSASVQGDVWRLTPAAAVRRGPKGSRPHRAVLRGRFCWGCAKPKQAGSGAAASRRGSR